MLTAFIVVFSLLMLIIWVSKKFRFQKTINFIHNADFIPITAGTERNYAGGIITLIYILTIFILISGVFVSFLGS
jgi:hypothetical protein